MSAGEAEGSSWQMEHIMGLRVSQVLEKGEKCLEVDNMGKEYQNILMSLHLL